MGAPFTLTPTALDAACADTLRRDGYCIVPNLVEPGSIGAIDRDLAAQFEAAPFCGGEFYGETTKRLGSLLKRSPGVEKLVLQPTILSIVRDALGPYCEKVLLNLTQAIEIHPGAPEQFPHRDQDMWGGPKGEIEYLVNVMWPLTPFTETNGATVVWPGSHRRQDEIMLPQKESIAAEMETGGALLFLGSTLHGGGSNRSELPRRGLVISYCLGWLRQSEAQTLIYPPKIARNFAPELAELVGYGIHGPNLGNCEGRDPAMLLAEERGECAQARFALRPEYDAIISQAKQALGTEATP